MFEVLKSMESTLLYSNHTLSARGVNIQGKKRANTSEPLSLSDRSSLYTGDDIAMVGLRRDAHHYRDGLVPIEKIPRNAFSVTRVYSAYLINIKNTYPDQGRPILFPQKPFMEDIDFEHACIEAQKLVLKHNKFFHRKVNFSKKAPKTGMIEWDEGTRFTVRNHKPTPYDKVSFDDFTVSKGIKFKKLAYYPKHTHFTKFYEDWDTMYFKSTFERAIQAFKEVYRAEKFLIYLPCSAVMISGFGISTLSLDYIRRYLQPFNMTLRVWNFAPGNLLVIEVCKNLE